MSATLANSTRQILIYDKSGSVTAGGTAQDAVAANPVRLFLVIENPSDATEVLYVDFGKDASTTAKTSVELQAGGSMFFDTACPTQRVSVTAVTTSHKFIVKEGY